MTHDFLSPASYSCEPMKSIRVSGSRDYEWLMLGHGECDDDDELAEGRQAGGLEERWMLGTVPRVLRSRTFALERDARGCSSRNHLLLVL